MAAKKKNQSFSPFGSIREAFRKRIHKVTLVNIDPGPGLFLEPLPVEIITDFSGHCSFSIIVRVENSGSLQYHFKLTNLSGGEVSLKDKIFGLHFPGKVAPVNEALWNIFLEPGAYPVGEIFTHTLLITATPVLADQGEVLEHRFPLTIGRGGLVLKAYHKHYVYNTDPEVADMTLCFYSLKEDIGKRELDKTPFLADRIRVAPPKYKHVRGTVDLEETSRGAVLLENLGFFLQLDQKQPFDSAECLVRCQLRNLRALPAGEGRYDRFLIRAAILLQIAAPDTPESVRQLAVFDLKLNPVQESSIPGSLRCEVKKTLWFITVHCPAKLTRRWSEMLTLLGEIPAFSAQEVLRIRCGLHRLATQLFLSTPRAWEAEDAWSEGIDQQLFRERSFFTGWLNCLMAVYGREILVAADVAGALRKFFNHYLDSIQGELSFFDFFCREQENFMTLVLLLTTGEREKYTCGFLEENYPTGLWGVKVYLWVLFQFSRIYQGHQEEVVSAQLPYLEPNLWAVLVGTFQQAGVRIASGLSDPLTTAELEAVGKFLFPVMLWQDKAPLLQKMLTSFWSSSGGAGRGPSAGS